MSFREKLAWGSLAAHIIVFGPYFFTLARNWNSAAAGGGHGLAQVAVAVVALVVLSIAVAVAAAASAPKEAAAPLDERERLVQLRAANLTAAIVTAGALGVIAGLMLGLTGALAANALLGVLVLGEITKAASHIVQLRVAA
ncbi:MAG: hypothetical protein R3C25_06045 [Hyphomonadaceae bacterium]